MERDVLDVTHDTSVTPNVGRAELTWSRDGPITVDYTGRGDDYGLETQWRVTTPWMEPVGLQLDYSLAPEEIVTRFGLTYDEEEQVFVALNLDLFHEATLGAKIEVRSHDLEQFEAGFKQVTSHSVLSHWSGLTLKHKNGPMSVEYETKFTFFPFESKLDLSTHLMTSCDVIPEVDVTLTHVRKKTIIT